MCIGVVSICPEAHTIVQHLVEAEFHLETVVLNLTLIDIRSLGSTIERRYGTVATRDKDILTVIGEVVEATCNQTTQECEVSTDVLLQYRCPFQVGSGN